MADDDQVNEAKSDIQAVQDIVGAGPKQAPPPPPMAAPIPPPTWSRDDDEPTDEEEAQRYKISLDEYRARRKAYDDEQSAKDQREWEQRRRLEDQRDAERMQPEVDNLLVGAPNVIANPPPDPEDAPPTSAADAADEADEAKILSGCSPALAAAILVVLALIAAGVFVVENRDSGSSKSATAAGGASSSDSCSQTGMRADHMVYIDCSKPSSPLDGHWVLVDGLNNPGFDMGIACDSRCQSARQLTVDKSEVTMDISGDKITGGTYKTGYSSTQGQACTEFNSHTDATISGGADQANKYGQLIVDGTQSNDTSCDSNLQPVINKSAFHTSRFYFLSAPDTLTVCYNINATFNGCTDVGFTTPPPNGGVAATLKRG